GEKIPTNPQVLSALQLTASVSQELQFHKVEYVLAPVDDRPCYATLIERLPKLLPALPHHPQENLRQALTEAAKIEDLSARQNAIANIEEASGLIYQNSTELREIYGCSGPNFLAVAEGGVGSCWELSHRLIHRMNALGAGPAIMAVAPTFTTDCKSFRRPGHCAALLLGQEGEMRVFDPTYWADSRRALFLTLMTIEEWEFAEEQLSSVDPEQAREFICSLRDKYEDSYQNAIGEAVVVHGEGHQFKHDYQAKSWEELQEETPRGRLLYGFAARDESLLMRVNTDPDASQFVKHLAAQCLAMFAKRPEFPRTPSILNYLADPYAGCREGDTPYVPVAVLRGCFKDACFEDVEDSALSSLLERTVGCALRRGQHVDPIEFYPAISTLLSRGVDVALEDESDPIRLTSIVKLIGYMKEVASGHGPTSMALQSEFARDLKAYFEAAGHSPKSLVLAGMNKGSGLKVEETEYLLSCFARIGEYEEEIVASDEGFDFTEETKQQLRGQLCSRICKAVRKNDFLELNGIHWEFFRDRVGLSEDFTEQVEEEILDVIDSRQNPALPSNPMTYLAMNEMSEALPSAMHFWQNVLQTLKDEGVVSERFLESISRPEREPREVWKVCGDRDSHEFVAEILGGSSGESSAMIMSEKYFKDGEERTAEMMNLRTVPLVVLRDLAQLHDEVVINRFSRLEREFGELKPSSADETMEEVFSRWKEGFPEDFEELIWLFPEETSESMLAAIHREFLKRLKQPHSLSSCEMALASRYAESSDGDAFRNLYQSATTKIAERFDAGDKRGTEEAIYDFRRKFFDERFLPMDSRDSLLLYALSVPEPKTFSHWREKAGLLKGERLSRKQVLIKLMDIVGASSDEWFVDQVWGSIQKLSSKGGDRQLEAVGTRFPRATQDKARNSPPASTGSFESFAEYLPGSHSFRQIDWRASAKRDSLVVQHKKDGDSVKVEVQLDLSATRDWRFGNRSGYVRILQELRDQILAHKVPTLVLSVAGTTVKEFSARELKAALFGHSIEGESPPRAFATLLQEFESYVIGFSRLSVVLPTQRLHAQFQPGGIRADGSNRVVSFYCDSSDKDSIERTLLSAKKRLGISGYVTAI
ncbi:MAG: DUF58 domain-containing protein, partial [Bdellovibrionales bacterium]|nr:DUF58 domain-containing protein [Bdellovibrionales bacterium]